MIRRLVQKARLFWFACRAVILMVFVQWRWTRLSFRPLLGRVLALPAGRLCPDVMEAAKATVWAHRRFAASVGLRDSCVSRSLVVAALVAGHPGATLHLGFRAAGDKGVEGHAWVCVGDHTIGGMDPGEAGQAYIQLFQLELQRRRRSFVGRFLSLCRMK